LRHGVFITVESTTCCLTGWRGRHTVDFLIHATFVRRSRNWTVSDVQFPAVQKLSDCTAKTADRGWNDMLAVVTRKPRHVHYGQWAQWRSSMTDTVKYSDGSISVLKSIRYRYFYLLNTGDTDNNNIGDVFLFLVCVPMFIFCQHSKEFQRLTKTTTSSPAHLNILFLFHRFTFIFSCYFTISLSVTLVWGTQHKVHNKHSL